MGSIQAGINDPLQERYGMILETYLELSGSHKESLLYQHQLVTKFKDIAVAIGNTESKTKRAQILQSGLTSIESMTTVVFLFFF
jgi:hypothetical protein